MTSDYILTSLNEGVRLIRFNNPKRKNALVVETYTRLTEILNEDAINDDVVLTVFTGIGEYYGSGNDFTQQLNDLDNLEEIIDLNVKIVKNYIKTLIDYPKLLIAIVNGPAIGFAVTTLALFDIVYASERASFVTPFVNLGICPEACSSYLFPRIMGRSKASEMLLLGRKLTPQEACKVGFVAEVIPHNQLEQLFQRLRKYGKLPVNSVKNAKKLIHESIKKKLHEANERECEMLTKCFGSEEFVAAILNFVNRSKSKL